MKKAVLLLVVISTVAIVTYGYTKLSITSRQREAPPEGYGDINGDGYVTVDYNNLGITDHWLLLAFFDEYGVSDVNEDGITNDVDLALVAQRWEETGSIHWIREDTSADGVINIMDTFVVTSFWNQTKTEPMSVARLGQMNISLSVDEVIFRGDVNGDGILTMSDVMLIYQYARGDIDSFPVQEAENQPPVAMTDRYRYNATAYQPLTIDGSSSYDPDGYIVAYKWIVRTHNTVIYETDWGDYPIFTYTWENIPAGATYTYYVELHVRDNNNSEATRTVMVYVHGESPPENHPPVVWFTITPSELYTHKEITIDASASFDPDGDALQFALLIDHYYIGYPDKIWQDSPIFKYTFTEGGEHTIGVEAKDIYGLTSTYNVVVNVIQRYGLLTKVVPKNGGTVKIYPPSSEYVPTKGYMFPEGSVVTLTAIPKNGYTFVRWSGSVNSSENPIAVTMDSDKVITAVFKEIETPSPPLPPSIPMWAVGIALVGCIGSVVYIWKRK